MANTFTLIESKTLGSSVATISFTSISSTYTDLCLKLSARASNAQTYDNFIITFNGSSSGYSTKLLYGSGTGNGASAGTSSATVIDYGLIPAATANASVFGNAEIYIPNYAGSNNKSLSIDEVTENNITQAFAALEGALWANTAAINQITLTCSTSNFVQYSTAYLYGIKNS